MPLAKVNFFDLRYDQRHRSPVLFLKDSDNDKFLPVWIGELEANSIELAVIHKNAPRPLTHDLFSSVLRALDVRVRKVIIDRLESRTYFATLYILQGDATHTVDCRPSDAIAIALRENAEIFVDDKLMYNIKFVELDESDVVDPDALAEVETAPDIEAPQEDFHEFLRRISPTDFKEH